MSQGIGSLTVPAFALAKPWRPAWLALLSMVTLAWTATAGVVDGFDHGFRSDFQWTWIVPGNNPLDTADDGHSFSNGDLRLRMRNGSVYLGYNNTGHLPNLTLTGSGTVWEIETEVRVPWSMLLGSLYPQAGLILFKDADHYLSASVNDSPFGLEASMHTEFSGTNIYSGGTGGVYYPRSDQGWLLRLSSDGLMVQLSYDSGDGLGWRSPQAGRLPVSLAGIPDDLSGWRVGLLTDDGGLGLPNGFDASFGYLSISGLEVNSIPEPGSAVPMAVGLALVLLGRWAAVRNARRFLSIIGIVATAGLALAPRPALAQLVLESGKPIQFSWTNWSCNSSFCFSTLLRPDFQIHVPDSITRLEITIREIDKSPRNANATLALSVSTTLIAGQFGGATEFTVSPTSPKVLVRDGTSGGLKTGTYYFVKAMSGTGSGVSITDEITVTLSSPVVSPPASVGPQLVQQGNKLVGTGAIETGGSGLAHQGYSVAISADGNTAIAGGWNDNGGTGAAWVYTRTGNTWSQQGGKLVGTGAVGNASQGYSVAISGDGNTAIIGGPADSSGAGAAWVYTRSGSVWSQQGTKLVGTGAAGTAHQGSSVALSADGSTAVVGGPADNATIGGSNAQGAVVLHLLSTGAAWVYTRSGSVWSQQGSKLVGTGAAGNVFANSSAKQGYSVAISGDGNTVIVGGPEDDVTIAQQTRGTGAAWVFTRSSSVWSQQGSKLVGTGAAGKANQGCSVAISGDGNTAVVGGYGDDNDTGAVWAYGRAGGGWNQRANKLVGRSAVWAAKQGSSVAISADGTTAIAGGPIDNGFIGAAWVYRQAGTFQWSQWGSKLVGRTTAASAPYFGNSVALSADGATAIAGGYNDASGAGAVWVFTSMIISSLSPAMATAGSSPFTLTVNGAGFVAGSKVVWNGGALSTSYVSDTQLTAVVPSSQVANPGTASVTVVNPGGDPSKSLSFLINPQTPLSITTVSHLPDGAVGNPYSQSLSAAGGTTPHKGWTIAAGSLPPGLALSTSGSTAIVGGVPTTSGTFTFTAQVTDGANAVVRQQFTLTIKGSIVISAAGVVNAASYSGGAISPGEFVTIFGSGMGSGTLAGMQLDNRGFVSTSLAGTQVLFDGVAAPLTYASVSQVGAVVPYSVSGKTSVQLHVSYQGQNSNAVALPVTSVAPGVFTSDASGRGQGSILNQDFTVNSPNNPAPVGSYVAVYATGEGQTDPGGTDGKPANSQAPTPVAQPTTATIDGINAPVVYAGGVPGLVAGVFQVNLQIPEGVSPGNSVPIVLTVGGRRTQTNVTLAVR